MTEQKKQELTSNLEELTLGSKFERFVDDISFENDQCNFAAMYYRAKNQTIYISTDIELPPNMFCATLLHLSRRAGCPDFNASKSGRNARLSGVFLFNI